MNPPRPRGSILLAGALVASAVGLAAAGPAALSGRTPLQSYLADHGRSPFDSSLARDPRAAAIRAAAAVPAGPTPGIACGPGSAPEKTQGRVPAADYPTGRATRGYTCNATEVAHFGTTGGFKVFRYVDKAGHACAFFDATLLVGTDYHRGASGVVVLDMTDSAHPVQTDTLRTPAMQSPHESLSLNVARGLLAATFRSPLTAPGEVDIYDVSQDCRHPSQKGISPLGILGHEAGFSPDGNTYYVSSLFAQTIVALDITDPVVPKVAWVTAGNMNHGLSVSSDGNRLYLSPPNVERGLTILDSSQIQKRVPNPTVPLVSHITWPEVSIPQSTVPLTIKGRPYLLEFDEYDYDTTMYSPDENVGAARLIDISNEKAPTVVSNLRLAVHEKAARAGDQQSDPNGEGGLQGYAAHYCSVPRQVDPGIVACSMILSGLRVFDIRDPRHPREIAYFNKPLAPETGRAGAYAMSAPAFDPAKHEIWYSDGNTGFYVVRLTNRVW